MCACVNVYILYRLILSISLTVSLHLHIFPFSLLWGHAILLTLSHHTRIRIHMCGFDLYMWKCVCVCMLKTKQLEKLKTSTQKLIFYGWGIRNAKNDLNYRSKRKSAKKKQKKTKKNVDIEKEKGNHHFLFGSSSPHTEWHKEKKIDKCSCKNSDRFSHFTRKIYAQHTKIGCGLFQGKKKFFFAITFAHQARKFTATAANTVVVLLAIVQSV